MKIFERTISRLMRQREEKQEPEILVTDPQQERAAIETVSDTYDSVSFGEGLSMDEIEEKSEYRKRRSVRALD